MPRLLALLAPVCFGTTGTAQALGPGAAPPTVGAPRTAIGGLLLAPVLIAGALYWLRSGDGIVMALFLGAIPTALAYALFARGLRQMTPGETATLTLAEPLTATGLEILAPGERPGALGGVGPALVLAEPLARALPAGRRAPRLASVAA